MSLLDGLFGIRQILNGGAPLFDARSLNFGAGLAAVYDAVEKRINVTGSAGAAGWFVVHAATGDVTAVAHDLVQVTPAGATTVVTAPAGAAGAYFGVQLCGQADAKIVEVRRPDTALLTTLYVDDEVVWFVYDYANAAWRVLSRSAPDPIYDARFSPLGTWLSSGADADISDTSGNARTLTKSLTILKANGAEQGRLATAYPGRYSNANAAFALGAGAVSVEFLGQIFLAQTPGGSVMQFGSGAGGSVNNIQYQLRTDLVAGVPCWGYRTQNGTNVVQDLFGPHVGYGWQHVLLTRSAAQAVKIYINGALGFSGTGVTPTGGGGATLLWGGTVGAQAYVNFQQGSIWGSELTAAQALYLSKLRLGARRP